MSSYRNMINIACFVAGIGVPEYDRSTIQDMCERTGAEAVIDFFEGYSNMFGIDTTAQQNWAYDIMHPEDE